MCVYVYTHTHKVFPGSSDGRGYAYNVGDMDLIPGLGGPSGEGDVYPV